MKEQLFGEKTVLTAERDIQFLSAGIPSSNLVLFCPGLQGRGSTLIDRSQKGNDGTITNATWIRTARGLRYLDFNGTNAFVSGAANLGVTGATARTLLLVAKSDKTDYAAEGTMFFSGAWSTTNAFVMVVNSINDHWSFRNYTSTLDTGVDVDTKLHIHAIVYDGSKLSYYIDGAVTSINGTSVTLNTTNSTWTLGRNAGTETRYFSGGLGFPVLYSTGLSEAEIVRISARIKALCGE